MSHVIWDWNGTLFNDVHLMARGTSAALTKIGCPPVDLDTYRRHHCRPMNISYGRMAGREITDDEWLIACEEFHDVYAGMLAEATLASDALQALQTLQACGVTQSLLSMWVHDRLVPFVEQMDVAHYFVCVQGQPNATGELKAKSLEQHLERLHLSDSDRNAITLIGDTVDDGEAATAVGISCHLVSTGSQMPDDLAQTGWPVSETLAVAVNKLTSRPNG
jgi:phosphoglycolate phosphatase-like HAD superfamily hydrolase